MRNTLKFTVNHLGKNLPCSFITTGVFLWLIWKVFRTALSLYYLVSTKWSHILKQTCSFQLQVWFKNVWPSSGHQALKGHRTLVNRCFWLSLNLVNLLPVTKEKKTPCYNCFSRNYAKVFTSGEWVCL